MQQILKKLNSFIRKWLCSKRNHEDHTGFIRFCFNSG